MLNKVSNILFIKPIKKLPDRVIIPLRENFNLVSLDRKKLLGYAKAFPEELLSNKYYKDYKGKSSYWMAELQAYERRQNVGTTLTNYIKKISKQDKDCKGRVHLEAHNFVDSGAAPGAFYYKLGFRTQDTSMNKFLKKAVDEHKDIPKMYNGLKMFLDI